MVILVALAAGVTAQAKIYIVSAGVSDYSNYPGGGCTNLKNTANDANDMAALYSSNSAAEYKLLTNGNATKRNVLSAIRQLHGKAAENDIVIFFFSGHGSQGGICLSDGHITFQQIRDAMASSRCKNKSIFLDSCHSGGLRANGSSDNRAAQQAARESNIMLFLSSRDNEISLDDVNGSNGMFTKYLIKGLQGKSDANGDRTITALELFNYVNPKVAAESTSLDSPQHPVMWGNFSNNMPVMVW